MNDLKIFNLFKNKIFPLHRSITGEGSLKTLKYLKSIVNLKIKKEKSQKKVFDWKIPPEWIIRRAYIEDKFNKKIKDIKNNNLHIVQYSRAINKKISKAELIKKIYSIKKLPNAIPYVTSYYKKDWGFCANNIQKEKIIKNYKNSDYFKVVIDSKFNSKGYLNYGEALLKGQSKKEILISTYICHPSMANNELSGPIVSSMIYNYFKKKKLNKSIRFLFIPETIGSIVYLNKNLTNLKKNVIGGYNLSCIGDERNHSCMLSKIKNAPSDLALIQAYKNLEIKNFKIHSFLKRGSDERQYNSPGIDLPITSIFRTKYHNFKEYHTSLDNFELVTLKGIKGGFRVAREAIKILDKLDIPKYTFLCEPFLTKRNLIETLSSKKNKLSKYYLDFLQYADGINTTDQISKKINLNKKLTRAIYQILKKNKICS